MESLLYIGFIIAIAFAFDFINGFHDASNSIATIVSTGVLKPLQAVIWAAFFNFIAFLFFHLNVAATVGTGLISPHSINADVIMAALLGAISFNLLTWYFGLPSSSSHALIGGLAGAALMQTGWHSLEFSGLYKVLIAIVLSPLLGFCLSYILISIGKKIANHIHSANKWARRFQLVSAAMLSLGHGGNDAQKTMGIIAGLLFSAGLLGANFYVPFWVVVSCNLVIALGTLAGGWRIVNTLGKKITPLKPIGGSAAETSSAIVLFLANYLGIPISTTHTVTGSIVGIGVQAGILATNWQVVKRIILAWIFTIPFAGLFAAGIIWLEIHFINP